MWSVPGILSSSFLLSHCGARCVSKYTWGIPQILLAWALLTWHFGNVRCLKISPLTLAEMRRNSARQSEIQTHYLPIPSSDKGSMADPEEIYSSSCQRDLKNAFSTHFRKVLGRWPLLSISISFRIGWGSTPGWEWGLAFKQLHSNRNS